MVKKLKGTLKRIFLKNYLKKGSNFIYKYFSCKNHSAKGSNSFEVRVTFFTSNLLNFLKVFK